MQPFGVDEEFNAPDRPDRPSSKIYKPTSKLLEKKSSSSTPSMKPKDEEKPDRPVCNAYTYCALVICKMYYVYFNLTCWMAFVNSFHQEKTLLGPGPETKNHAELWFNMTM
jgi:hypothetical protein